jgi:DNA-binding SARP family transcriptional activator
MVGRLWPDKDEHSARHCLATSLWRIRSQLPPDQTFIRIEGETIAVSFSRFDWLDSVVFEMRAQMALASPGELRSPRARLRLRNALALYGGPFLQERDYEWAVLERERLRTLYLDALFALAHSEMEAGNWVGARSAAQSLCAAEPLREDAQRLLMSAHAECGNRALAINQYHSLVSLLRNELGISPMLETQLLAAKISGTPQPHPSAAIAELRRDAVTLRQVRFQLEQSLQLIDATLNSQENDLTTVR